jgi:phospholipid/cholesterol/gamma-HCH transport system substrate-binding protein
MIFGKTKLELKVGVFVFIGLVLLAVLILSIGGFKTWTSGYNINFIFHFVNGVKVGAPVRYAGVDVGEVKILSFIPAGQEGKVRVKVNCWLKKDTLIPIDSTIWVNTLGLLGEKYIEIIPGKDFNNVLSADQELTGKDPLSMQEVTDLASKIVKDADEVILKIKNKEGTIGKLIGDDTIYNELDALVKDIRKHPWKLFWKGKEKKEDK